MLKVKAFFFTAFQMAMLICFGQQNILAGTYATDFLDVRGIRFYNNSISFVYGKDSFYYWSDYNHSQQQGKGTYQIEGKKLYLQFENTKQQKPLVSEVEILPFDSSLVISGKSEFFFSAFYKKSETLSGASLEIKTGSGRKAIYSILNNPQTISFKSSDFPLSVKGFNAECKPVYFKIDKPGNYKIALFFQPFANEQICNGEKWVYDIGSITWEKIIMKQVRDENMDNKNFKPFIFISYKRGLE